MSHAEIPAMRDANETLTTLWPGHACVHGSL